MVRNLFRVSDDAKCIVSGRGIIVPEYRSPTQVLSQKASDNGSFEESIFSNCPAFTKSYQVRAQAIEVFVSERDHEGA